MRPRSVVEASACRDFCQCKHTAPHSDLTVYDALGESSLFCAGYTHLDTEPGAGAWGGHAPPFFSSYT
eukprot:8747-Eustigmatos_ZCMA.PRE.1